MKCDRSPEPGGQGCGSARFGTHNSAHSQCYVNTEKRMAPARKTPTAHSIRLRPKPLFKLKPSQ